MDSFGPESSSRDSHYVIKIIFVGDAGVGKSSLLCRYANEKAPYPPQQLTEKEEIRKTAAFGQYSSSTEAASSSVGKASSISSMAQSQFRCSVGK